MKALMLILTTAVVVATAPGFPAAEGKLTISGYVGNSSTSAAPGMNVVLYAKGSEQPIDSVSTNFMGRYKFDKLEPGEYVVKVGKVAREVVLVKKNIRMDIDLSAESGLMDYAKGAAAAAAASPSGGSASAGPSDPGLMQAMAGQWYSYSGSTERKVMLCSNGVYSNASESSYSGTTRDGLGNQTGAWGAGGQSQGQGSWSIQGNQQQGVITLVERNGSRSQVRYQATGEKGCFTFNGNTFCYAGEARCQ